MYIPMKYMKTDEKDIFQLQVNDSFWVRKAREFDYSVYKKYSFI